MLGVLLVLSSSFWFLLVSSGPGPSENLECNQFSTLLGSTWYTMLMCIFPRNPLIASLVHIANSIYYHYVLIPPKPTNWCWVTSVYGRLFRSQQLVPWDFQFSPRKYFTGFNSRQRFNQSLPELSRSLWPGGDWVQRLQTGGQSRLQHWADGNSRAGNFLHTQVDGRLSGPLTIN